MGPPPSIPPLPLTPIVTDASKGGEKRKDNRKEPIDGESLAEEEKPVEGGSQNNEVVDLDATIVITPASTLILGSVRRDLVEKALAVAEDFLTKPLGRVIEETHKVTLRQFLLQYSYLSAFLAHKDLLEYEHETEMHR
ncbi:hypothetical protein ACOSQ2_007080 [Xanthoceras sorbifolium]